MSVRSCCGDDARGHIPDLARAAPELNTMLTLLQHRFSQRRIVRVRRDHVLGDCEFVRTDDEGPVQIGLPFRSVELTE